MMAWPHYAPSKTTIQYHGIPVGEVDIRRGERVRADDGAIGRVQGLVVDAADQHATHVLLEHVHLRGAQDLAIPIGAVTRTDVEAIHVSLSRQAIAALPHITVEPPAQRA
jgi:hypothetical protein